MVEKVKFLSISGPKTDIDWVVDKYLTKYDIHLENAVNEYKSNDLITFNEVNPYNEILSSTAEIVKQISLKDISIKPEQTVKESISCLEKMMQKVDSINSELIELKNKRSHLENLINQIRPFSNIDYELKKILDFKFLKFRFGRIHKEYYSRISDYKYEQIDVIFIECEEKDDYIYGIYFVPIGKEKDIDKMYTSLHFDRINLPDEYNGTMQEAFETLNIEVDKCNIQIKELNKKLDDSLKQNAEDVMSSYEYLKRLSNHFEVRKYAGCTKNKGKQFYVLCGYMAEKDIPNFIDDVKEDPSVYCFVEGVDVKKEPPTKLKNLFFAKPFEMFIRMYGLPAYNEIDPTLFMALTYPLIFGIMFGDVGQGAVMLLFSMYLYNKTKGALWQILGISSIFSIIFGFMYGSCFGFEDILPALLVKPMETVNSVLITSVFFGIVLIFISMLFNMINAKKQGNLAKLLFSPNGLCGFIFYSFTMYGIIQKTMYSKNVFNMFTIGIFIVIPLILVYIREILERIIEKEKPFPEDKILFLLEMFFEFFEVMLSYLSNTVSFVRVGAFALSHAGMMSVVLMLGNVEKGTPNFLVIVLGNILVMGIEGLIVGIQVLRLECYELFSRFYSGTGREFISYNNKIK